MSKDDFVKDIVVPPNIKTAVLAIDRLMPEREMKVVADHHICYGTDTPLCGVLPIGGRGLINDEGLITCPECKKKLKK